MASNVSPKLKVGKPSDSPLAIKYEESYEETISFYNINGSQH